MGPAFGSVCFVGKNGANTGLQITLSDQSPSADNAAKGPGFHLLELTQRVGLRGEET